MHIRVQQDLPGILSGIGKPLPYIDLCLGRVVIDTYRQRRQDAFPETVPEHDLVPEFPTVILRECI